MIRRLRPFVACLALLAGCEESFPAAPPPGIVDGVVLDLLDGLPVAGAEIRALEGVGSATTDAEGRFELSLPAGLARISLRREGYFESEHAYIRVPPGGRVVVRPRMFRVAPTDATINAYFHARERRPDPSEAPRLSDDGATGDVGHARTALHIALPTTIRVWRASLTPALAPSSPSWTDNSCDVAAIVEELLFEEYVKGVVPHEWFPSWDVEAHRAGAIAARSYALSHVLSGGRWACADVDDGTVTQVYRSDRAPNVSAAVDDTAGMLVVRDGAVVRAEYSAENSDPTAFAVDDPTCTLEARFGHGRGMCQWGTQRWATGSCASPPCDFGTFGAAPKDHVWMVAHYYPGAAVHGGEPAPPCRVLGPEGGILDDAGPCFLAFGPPEYWRTEPTGHDGGLHWTDAFSSDVPANWAQWSVHFASGGRFRAEVYIDPAWGVYPETRYRITHAAGETEIIVDQGAVSGWVDLGVYDFGPDGSVAVFDDYLGAIPTDQHIVADALRLGLESATFDGGASDAGAFDAGASDPSILDGGAVASSDGGGDRRGLMGGCGCALAPGVPVPSGMLFTMGLFGLAVLARRRR